ncbi:igE-binding protein-like [Apodemus sylvaticus]|uniref:igE-binding protein-like n=1 Tax=Apodemus sylvaticus TaxID=10129 RepID=UPI002243C947|nr:igE-binding protein-like [Apodemus sylvaticus]
MGNNLGAGPGTCDFAALIQGLLKQRGLKISPRTVETIVKDIDKAAPWFAVSGDFNLDCWEKLGEDLERAKQEDRIGRGSIPLWKLVHSCLKDSKNMELIKQGRKVLASHQDSLSEAESRGEEDRPAYNRDKREKKRKIKQGENKEEPLYPVLEEFANLEISDDSVVEGLSEEDQEELEEAAAEYERDRYGRQPILNKARVSAGPVAPSAPCTSLAPPPYRPSGGGCHFIGGKMWERLASAFPVFQNPQTNERYHEPVPYKQLKDLVEAAKTYGANASYTLALLNRLASQPLTPSDWSEVARASLSTGQYLDYRSLVVDMAHAQARVNVQNQHPQWDVDMLMGIGRWAANQTQFPIEVYAQINDIYQRAWKALPKKGEVVGNLTKILQGTNEPFSEFVARMMEAAERVFGDSETAAPLVKQLVYEQCTKECRRAITPWKGRGIDVWLKACREISGPLSNAGLAAAVVTAARRAGACFRCGQTGHFKKQCSQVNRGVARVPGTCPKCKKGRHWANECRSVKDINGQPIHQNAFQPKNGKQGPRPQGPKIFGAIQESNMKLPLPPGEQHQAPQDWTSVPPPDWY